MLNKPQDLLFWHVLLACVVCVVLGDVALGPYKLAGAGATFPNTLYQDAMFSYKFVDSTSELSYLGTGSGGGKCRITTGSTECDTKGEPYVIDFAGSDSLLSEEQYAEYPDLQMYPTVAGAVTASFSHPEVEATGLPLVMRMSTIARIYSGEITAWDHPDILADQAHDEVISALESVPGQPIEVVVRSDKSGTTEIWTKALIKALEQGGMQNDFITASSKSDSAFSNPDVTLTEVDGNSGVGAYTNITPYALGYVVLGYALQAQLSVIHLRSSNGRNVIAPSVSSVEFALAELGLDFGNTGEDAARLTADIQGAQGSLAWPAAGYTYLVMRKETDVFNDCERRSKVVSFWEWFYTSDVARALATVHGFAPLPEFVMARVLDRLLNDIKCADGSLAKPEVNTSIPISYAGPRLLEPVIGLYGQSYASMNEDLRVFYTPIETDKTANEWATFARGRAANEPLIAPRASDGSEWWARMADVVSVPLVGVTTGVYVNVCESSSSCTQQTPGAITSVQLARIVSGDLSGSDVWTALGMTVAADPLVLCPPSGSAERRTLENALRASYDGFTWNGCDNTADTDVGYTYTESALLSKPGTIGFHYLTEDLEAETTALLNVDGQQSLQDDYFFIIRKDQGECTVLSETIAKFTGWMYGHPKTIEEGQTVDFAKPLTDAGFTAIGHEDGSGVQAVDLIACDGVSILNPPVDGPAPDLTSFVLMGTLAGVVLAIAGTVGWGVKTGRISMDRIMQTLFDEHICIITDMLFNFGDVMAFTLTVFITIPSDDVFINVKPIGILFMAIGWISTVITLYISFSLLIRIFRQRREDVQRYVAARASKIAKRASFRAMQEGGGIHRKHIDDALSQLHAGDKGQMDEVEHFERELWRKQGDIITVCCEAIPVMAIQFKILSLAPDFSAISVISIILASGIAGSKLSGLTTYTDLRSKLKDASERLRKRVKEELKTMASMDEENAQYTQGTRGTDGHASQENPGGSGAGSGTGSGSDSQSKLPPKPNKGGLRGVFGAANRQVADAAYSVV